MQKNARSTPSIYAASDVRPTGILILEDGTVLEGIGFGASGEAVAEICFNTSITGYQEILTDPSYAGQIITFTFPHIGNVGVNNEDLESLNPHSTSGACGLVVKADITQPSNWRAVQHLNEWLQQKNIIGLSNIDTRALTSLIREKGYINGVIAHNEKGEFDIEKLKAKAARWSGLEGLDLVPVVASTANAQWTQGIWDLEAGYSAYPSPNVGEGGALATDEGFKSAAQQQKQSSESFLDLNAISQANVRVKKENPSPALSGHPLPQGDREECRFNVVVLDFGIKRNILRLLVDAGCKLTIVPPTTSAAEILALKPDGVFLSNGPGDPAATGEYAVPTIQAILDAKIPVFGICLGHQMLALAVGGKTLKMRQGHHGANHPVKDTTTGKVEITSMNHGFAVDADTLPANVQQTHISLFDGTNCGLQLLDRPAFSVQHHPEASPGPQDSHYLFARFVDMMKKNKI